MQGQTRWSAAGVLIGLGLLVIAAVIAADALNMRVPPVHAKVGPRIFPFLISAGLAIAGLAVAWQAWRGGAGMEEAPATDWKAVAIIAGGLLLHMNLLRPAGFVVAAMVLFLSVTAAFGSRRFLRDGAVGLALSLAAYLAFTRLLGLQLPGGILQGLI